MLWDRSGTLLQTRYGEYAIHAVGKAFYVDFSGSVRDAKTGKTLGRFETKRAAQDAAECDFAQRLSDDLDQDAVAKRRFSIRLSPHPNTLSGTDAEE